MRVLSSATVVARRFVLYQYNLVATYDAAPGAEVEAQFTGVVELNKIGTQAWAVGDKVVLGQHEPARYHGGARQYPHRRGGAARRQWR